MHYEVTGIYTNKKKSNFNNSILFSNNDKVYEIQEHSENSLPYLIVGSSLVVNDLILPLKSNFKKILVFPKIFFICYRTTLQMFESSGNLIKEIESKESIYIGSYGFLILGKTPFIVNYQGNFIFSPRPNNVLNFTEDGTIFSVDSTESIIDTRFDCQEENTVKGTLVIESMKNKKAYDKDGECILEFQDYKIFKNTAIISDIISCASIKLEALPSSCENLAIELPTEMIDCVIVVCKGYVFTIFGDIVVRKATNANLTKIIPDRFVIHNYLEEASVYDCILFINCFRTISLTKWDEIESFLSSLMNFNHKITTKFINGLKWNSLKSEIFNFTTLMCKVFRLVDDISKAFIESWIDFSSLNADQMFYVVIYKPDLLEKFISLCKSERKLFYLPSLKDFYIKTGRAEICKKKLLEQGLLVFEYEGLEIFNEIENRQIESQRLECLSKFTHPINKPF